VKRLLLASTSPQFPRDHRARPGTVLAFGWSTAVIVATAVRLTRTRHQAQMRRPRRPV